MDRTKIVFLYSEIAGYFLACVNALSEKAEVLVVRWPVNNEAPFKIKDDSKLTILCKADYSVAELEKRINDFQPDTIVCSGWMDKDYLGIIKRLGKDVNKVLSLDNHWNGSLKQRIAGLISPFFLKKTFSHAWVPGKHQYTFAEKLGFKGNIMTGFYCADTGLFNEKFQNSFDTKKAQFPKRFLYVARYVEHKGIFEMWNAFVELQEEMPNDWELWCLGTGDQWENRIKHEKIKHFGFVQPDEMDTYISDTGVYILPSKFEPWGVSAQEFAISGFPLLLSNEIGSKELFLNEDNGLLFEAGNKEAIKASMKTIINKVDSELIEMGKKSHELGMAHTTDQWVDKILALR